tara:strand:+ start:75329 stop:75646 length:318 start_codon:yes stop_codon:yes gene_type:complete
MRNIKLKLLTAAAIFAELGHPARLSIVKELVKSGSDGVNTGKIGEKLNIPNSTLTHHIRRLESVGLIEREQIAQRLVCRMNAPLIKSLSHYLLDACCTQAKKKSC